jgi:hypothetical protein
VVVYNAARVGPGKFFEMSERDVELDMKVISLLCHGHDLLN